MDWLRRMCVIVVVSSHKTFTKLGCILAVQTHNRGALVGAFAPPWCSLIGFGLSNALMYWVITDMAGYGILPALYLGK